MHCAVGRKDIAQCPKAGIRVGQVVEHPRTHNLVENLAEFPDIFDCKPIEIEVSQAIFLLKIAGMAQTGFADVDCRHSCIGLAQRMDGSLGCSAAGDQDFTTCPRMLCWPQ